MSNADLPWEDVLFKVFGKETKVISSRSVGGGSYNGAEFLETDIGRFFVKTNFNTAPDTFEKEASGLGWLGKNGALKVPKVYGHGIMEGLQYLVMEWIPSGSPGKNYWEDLGRGLAGLHRTSAKQFGFVEDNYISILPQHNPERGQWVDFFIEERLERMLALASSRGLLEENFLKKFRKIYPRLPSWFPKESPALLHGDLWSGNVLVTEEGSPSLIDPAVYFGHREMDLAFSRLFGGFSGRFYSAYQEIFPLAPDFESRKDLYNLYPLLVHLILFGRSYFASIENVIKKYGD